MAAGGSWASDNAAKGGQGSRGASVCCVRLPRGSPWRDGRRLALLFRLDLGDRLWESWRTMLL